MSVQRGVWGQCLLGAMLIALAAPVLAEIYQWKDEQGKTVFSERPPPGSDAKVVKPKTGKPSSNASEKLRQDRERIVPPVEKPKEQKPKELTEEQLEQKAEACAQARDALALLQANNRPRYETEDGKIAHMSQEMHAERVADAEKKVSDYCN